jgi:hypothetical protein
VSRRTSVSHPTTAVALVAAAFLALAACAGASSISPATPSTTPATVSPSAPTTSPSPAAPASSPLPGFTTAIPPAADQPWARITWRALTHGDPLGDVRSAVRWDGGFVAVGVPVVTDGSSRTPVWTSPDGASWSALDPSALGTSTVLLDVVATADGLAALTLQGGSSSCTVDELRAHWLDCLALTLPLQVFTSSDGLRWTAGAGPDLPLQAEYGGESGWTYLPRLVAGEPGLLAYVWERPALGASRPTALLALAREPALPAAPGLSSTEAQGPCRLAYSADGVAWETLPADVSPAGFICSDIAPIAGGFAAVGLLGEDRSGALWSADGRAWKPVTTPPSRWFPRSIAAGSDGLVALGDTGVTADVHATPGPSLSWSSTDGRAWTMLQAEGIIVADGERFVDYRGGTKPTAWTSFDGLAWQPVEITPTTPPGLGQLLAMPIGLLWIGDDGAMWFGEPTAP